MALIERIATWLPLVFRAVAVYVLVLGPTAAGPGPAVQKITNNAAMVGYFANLGIPAPEVMVIVVALVEWGSVVAFVLGAAGRAMAALLAIEMIVAIALTTPGSNNLAVLISSVGILLLGTGALSLWQPEAALLRRWRAGGTAQHPA